MSEPRICPRTGTTLRPIEVAGVKVDLSEGCGGVWFDRFELRHFDEPHESEGVTLFELMEKYRTRGLDLSKRLMSPVSPDVVMMRRYFSPARRVEIDECPQSGGIWLDAGELLEIRMMYSSEEERLQHAREFVHEIIEENPAFSGTADLSNEELVRARRFANMFRFICPSYYLKGKIPGGAF